MKTYIVEIPYFASVIRVVDAENEEQAVRLALSEGEPELCDHCAFNVALQEQDHGKEIVVEEIKEQV